VFVLGKPIQTSNIFVSKASNYPKREHPTGLCLNPKYKTTLERYAVDKHRLILQHFINFQTGMDVQTILFVTRERVFLSLVSYLLLRPTTNPQKGAPSPSTLLPGL
jgi:hypothetical protein